MLAGCGGTPTPVPAATIGLDLPAINVTSPDFADGRVAVDATCDGSNRPPTAIWNHVPDGAAEVVVDLSDPDAADFAHWLVYGLPANSFRVSPLPPGALEGVNGFGRRGYGGPCPPRGAEHRYVLRVLAVAAPLGLAAGESRPDLYRALTKAGELAAGEVSARYLRK